MEDLRRIALNLQRYSKEKPFYDISRCFRGEGPSLECKSFLENCLIVDINNRKSARWLLTHPWIKNNCGTTESDITVEEKVKMMNDIVKYDVSSSFFKVIASFAIGLRMDTAEGMKE